MPPEREDPDPHDRDGREADVGEPFVEPRWPVALAVSTYIAITIVLRVMVPRRESIGPHWVIPGVEIVLLIVLLAANPGGSDARARRLRTASIVLTVLLGIAAILSTAILIVELVGGGKVTGSADSLLASGALVWIGNALVFGLVYWQMDSGGPLARYRGNHAHPDFAFTQQLNPELAPEGWRARYVDYFILGITTSTAFSPTDVMPLAPWAKLAMAMQSLISLIVIGLVIARAVNVFT